MPNARYGVQGLCIFASKNFWNEVITASYFAFQQPTPVNKLIPALSRCRVTTLSVFCSLLEQTSVGG